MKGPACLTPKHNLQITDLCVTKIHVSSKLRYYYAAAVVANSTAVIAQIVQTGDKSMKLGTITKFTTVNIFGYGVTLISPMESRTEHAPKY